MSLPKLLNKELDRIVLEISRHLANDQEPEPLISRDDYDLLQQNPQYGLDIIQYLASLDHVELEMEDDYLSGCFRIVDICLANLRFALERHERWAVRLNRKLQELLVTAIEQNDSSALWSHLMSILHETGINLDETVKQTYLDLITSRTDELRGSLNMSLALQQLIENNPKITCLEIIDLFLSQTQAMPQEFFIPFIRELVNTGDDLGKDVAILFLLNPDKTIRTAVMNGIIQSYASTLVTPQGMSYLLKIRDWMSSDEAKLIEEFINQQRKRGATFAPLTAYQTIYVKATEVDGSGVQAIIFLIKVESKYIVGGALAKYGIGIRDVWHSQPITRQEADTFLTQGLNNEATFREVNAEYAEKLISHYIAVTNAADEVPPPALLELQRLTNINWKSKFIDIKQELKTLASQIGELSEADIKKSLVRSAKWYETKSFTESWFEQDEHLDRIVNQYCSFIEGIKFCDIEAASKAAMTKIFETRRERWLSLFLWMTLWARAKPRANEKLWIDFFILANSIAEDLPLNEIPLMKIICQESIIISMETMQSRGTHLS